MFGIRNNLPQPPVAWNTRAWRAGVYGPAFSGSDSSPRRFRCSAQRFQPGERAAVRITDADPEDELLPDLDGQLHFTGRQAKVKVRSHRCLRWITVTFAMFGAACSSDPGSPQQLATIPASAASPLAGVVSLHVPGSILDSYVTLDVTSGSGSFSPISVAACEWIAAKLSPKALEVILYKGAASLRSSDSGDASSSTAVNLFLKNIHRSATDDDIKRLTAEGYATVHCEF